MQHHTIGILHPGAMGSFIAASLQQSQHRVLWASAGRSSHTHQRAQTFKLEDVGTLAHLCASCDVIVSVCPPDVAEAVAAQVIEHAFRGLYLDANAIAPQRADAIGQRMEQAGITFVEGGIVGGPAWDSGQTHLYLAGERAAAAAALFTTDSLATHVIGDTIGQASALKMCYAAYTKGTTALLGTILAAAEELGVRAELESQWAQDWPDFAAETQARVVNVTAKAWRFAGEMQEIAATFQAVGLPGGFHDAAATIYRRLAPYKDAPAKPALQDVLQSLIDGP